jgi:hypothetical protein
VVERVIYFDVGCAALDAAKGVDSLLAATFVAFTSMWVAPKMSENGLDKSGHANGSLALDAAIDLNAQASIASNGWAHL